MTSRRPWTEQQLLVALTLYCRLSFGQFHQHNSEIIKYAALIGRSPSALAMKLSNFASLDPVITQSGRKGLDGASTTDRRMWEEMNQNWGDFASRSHAVMTALEAVPDETETTVDYTGGEQIVSTKQRIGQAVFRSAVLSAYNHQCCISGLTIPKLLIASHIVPWKNDPNNRLNPRNGLALSALHDKAFDIGLLSIDSNYRVVISPALANLDDPFLQESLWGFHGKEIMLPTKFTPDAGLLRIHFETIFIAHHI